jgi:cytochrome c5
MADPHASPIKTPKQLITVVVLAFVVPIAVIVLLVTYVASERGQSAGSRALTPEAVAERLRPVGSVVLAEAAGAKTSQSGEAVYKLACVACHGAGVAGAPKSGDSGAWAPRIKQGYETLVKHALEGFKAMPPKGGNASLDDLEVARAVVYMANESGAKFKEPAAPAAPATAAAPAAAPAAAAPSAAPASTPAPAPTQTAAAPAGKADAAASGEQLYKQSCIACHAAGVAGAPKTGDKAAWAPRIKQGEDALVASVIKGKGAMPPRGASTATDAEIRAAVEYLMAQAK